MATTLTNAVQYVRMSTDMQRYSIENQSDAIARYAATHALRIVRSYEDAGRSGLHLRSRPALKALIADVMSGKADFEVILVYDVSRWGRFQDTDESAHYEFLCREAGVAIEYCAEPFQNDGSILATLLKNIKRAMAGEFSRELSVKVFAGQSRLAAMGFHVGAGPGYSLRRFLLDENGNRKMELAFGQRKSVKTERVILVPGPPEELRTVHQVYDLFIDEKASLNEIARILNRQNIPNVSGRAWTSVSVRELLANEKYVGNCVYNRTSKKLGVNWHRNPRKEWVVKSAAFEPVVLPQRFEKAQQQLVENATQYTDNDMLDHLTATWCQEKYLTRDLIDAARNGPSDNTYKKHFGNLLNAYRRVGFTTAFTATRTTLRAIRKAVCVDLVSGIRRAGGTVDVPPGWSCQLLVNGELKVSIVVGRTSLSHVASNQNQWRFGYRSLRKPDILIVARIDQGSSEVRDYFVLPFVFLPAGSWLTVSGINYERLERFRSPSLDPFYALCARRSLGQLSQ